MTWYLPTISKLHTILHPLAHCVSHLVMFVSWGRCWAPKHRLLQGRWKWLDQLTPFDTQLFSLMGLGQNECSECRPNFTYFDFWWLGWNGKEGDIYSTIVTFCKKRMVYMGQEVERGWPHSKGIELLPFMVLWRWSIFVKRWVEFSVLTEVTKVLGCLSGSPKCPNPALDLFRGIIIIFVLATMVNQQLGNILYISQPS